MRYHPFRDFGLKLVSLVLAILLWMAVAAQQSPVDRGMRIPLEVQNLPPNLEMVDAPQETVDVRVRGAGDTLARLAPGDLVASIDLSAAQPGRRLFHVSPDRVRVPFGVQVTQVTPSSVAFRFEPSASRTVPVHPTLEGEPAPGYIVDEMQVQPKSVEVVGPESALRRVTEALTEPVWVGDASAAVKATVAVAVAESGVRLKSPRAAQVQVQIVPAPAERQLNVPVRMRGLMSGLNAVITPPLVRVRVRGTTTALNRLKDSAVLAFVDLDGIAEGDYGLPVRVEKIPGVGIDQPDPAIVRIHVE